jgi:1,2-diacylglycerol 3-beta-galactosyltransferase
MCDLNDSEDKAVELKRILILTADVGFGHRSAANAIAAALQDKYPDRCNVEILNPLDDERMPALLRDTQTDYDRLVREMPDLYKFQYQISDTAVPVTLVESAVTVLMYGVMKDILRRSKPDMVVSTHPLYPSPLNAVITLGKRDIPFFTVITDMGAVHRIWFNPTADLVCVPNQNVYQTALESKLPASIVKITGIPVHPNLVKEHRPKPILRAELRWQVERTTALIVGSKRVKNLEPMLNVINHSGLPLQLAIVAGGDDELYARLKEVDWHVPAHLYNFVTNLPTMMHASDLIICKAGGLITTEALACCLPLLLVDVTPGQEEGNADYVVQNGAGDLAKTPINALETLFHWLDHQNKLLQERALNASNLGQPLSAYVIADYAWNAATREPRPLPESKASLRPKIKELLNQFGIS